MRPFQLLSPVPPLDQLTLVPPKKPLVGTVNLPGSKSITNRTLLVAALADGISTIRGALKSDDTAYMAAALRELGVKVEEPDATTFVVHGRSGHFVEPMKPLFLGNAGTAMRFLTAAATLVVGQVVLTGDERMQMRPIEDLTNALSQLSVKIETNAGCPPVTITSTGKLTGYSVHVKGSMSSQYVSAILMALPYAADREVTLEIDGTLASRGYVDITTAVMAAFGVMPLASGARYVVPKKHYRAADFTVEPDASSATYFWAAEALTGGKIDIAHDSGAWIQPDATTRELIREFPKPLGVVDGSDFPDAVPTLAVLAAFADGTTRFTNIKNLRVKECDRIVAIVTELNKIKPGLAEEKGDEIIVYGDHDLVTNAKSASIFTYNDHRIAMAFALAGLRLPHITITNPACVSKSFPHYFDVLAALGVTYA